MLQWEFIHFTIFFLKRKIPMTYSQTYEPLEIGCEARTPHPLFSIRNRTSRQVIPCWTNRLLQDVRWHWQARLHSNIIGGSNIWGPKVTLKPETFLVRIIIALITVKIEFGNQFSVIIVPATETQTGAFAITWRTVTRTLTKLRSTLQELISGANLFFS